MLISLKIIVTIYLLKPFSFFDSVQTNALECCGQKFSKIVSLKHFSF